LGEEGLAFSPDFIIFSTNIAVLCTFPPEHSNFSTNIAVLCTLSPGLI
jgi:hypothetical protein